MVTAGIRFYIRDQEIIFWPPPPPPPPPSSCCTRTKKMHGASWFLCARHLLQLEETRAEQNRTHDNNRGDDDDYDDDGNHNKNNNNASCERVVPTHTHTHTRPFFYKWITRLYTWSDGYLGGGNPGELVFGTRMSDAVAFACTRLSRRRSSRPRRRRGVYHRGTSIYSII